jgi:hypothetical protein
MVGPISEGVAQEVEVGSSGVTLMWKLEREWRAVALVVFSAHLANLPDEIVLDLAANEF